MAEHFDVLIIGAGLSGVGMACHLRVRHAFESDRTMLLNEPLDDGLLRFTARP